jgi:hypothetical protein
MNAPSLSKLILIQCLGTSYNYFPPHTCQFNTQSYSYLTLCYTTSCDDIAVLNNKDLVAESLGLHVIYQEQEWLNFIAVITLSTNSSNNYLVNNGTSIFMYD